MDLISVNREKCIQCGICVKICPPMILSMEENGPQVVNPKACIACGHCVAVCPNMAIDNIRTPRANQVTLKNFPVIDATTAQQFLRSRRSIRCYKNTKVPREQLLKLVDIARFAPTASNKQGISYIIVEDPKILKKVTEVTIQWMEANQSQWWSFPIHIRAYREHGIDGILHSAPNLIIATALKDFKNSRENTMLSFSYLELFANTLGLGSAWAGLIEMCASSKYYPLLELFNIPDDKKLTGAVMVGYPQYSFQRLVDRNPLDVTWM
ncbi:MAG TPA: ferredoxin [Firmicutes bacterium]|jgi:nitroreductase/NAD-dependent dihydropyrimidine dehydrogenase PreA subunit|nr:ferredoxin [Bacillota bacterium]